MRGVCPGEYPFYRRVESGNVYSSYEGRIIGIKGVGYVRYKGPLRKRAGRCYESYREEGDGCRRKHDL